MHCRENRTEIWMHLRKDALGNNNFNVVDVQAAEIVEETIDNKI